MIVHQWNVLQITGCTAVRKSKQAQWDLLDGYANFVGSLHVGQKPFIVMLTIYMRLIKYSS